MLPFFGVDRKSELSRFCASLVVFLVELLDTSGCIHNFLCTRVERMAFRANFNMESRFAQGRFGFKSVTTAAGHGNFGVLWVYIGFHLVFLVSIVGAASSTHA